MGDALFDFLRECAEWDDVDSLAGEEGSILLRKPVGSEAVGVGGGNTTEFFVERNLESDFLDGNE